MSKKLGQYPNDIPDGCVIEETDDGYEIVNWWDYGVCSECNLIIHADHLYINSGLNIICDKHASGDEIDEDDEDELNEAWFDLIGV